MFDQMTVAHTGVAHRAWTTGAGFAGQALLVATAILLPLVAPPDLPRMQTLVTLFLPLKPPPPLPPRLTNRGPAEKPRIQFQQREGRLFEPVSVPSRVAMIEEPPVEAMGSGDGVGVPGGVEGGVADGSLAGVIDSIVRHAGAARAVEPPPPVREKAEPARPAARVRMGGLVVQGKLIRRVMPVYPPLARQARVAGTVELLGVIGVDGRLKELTLISGHPLLVKAAMDAVRQWLYQTTYLNGEPVEVQAPITVSFRME